MDTWSVITANSQVEMTYEEIAVYRQEADQRVIEMINERQENQRVIDPPIMDKVKQRVIEKIKNIDCDGLTEADQHLVEMMKTIHIDHPIWTEINRRMTEVKNMSDTALINLDKRMSMINKKLFDPPEINTEQIIEDPDI